MPWNLILTLPNLAPPIPTPFDGGAFVICSANDERVRDLADNAANATGRRMLDNFRTSRGEQYLPGCLLVRSETPDSDISKESIRAFRNVCAIAATTSTWATRLARPHAAQWTVSWSDQVLFGYFSPGRNGWIT